MWVEKGFFILSKTVGGLSLCAYSYFLLQLNGIKESFYNLGFQTSYKTSKSYDLSTPWQLFFIIVI